MRQGCEVFGRQAIVDQMELSAVRRKEVCKVINRDPGDLTRRVFGQPAADFRSRNLDGDLLQPPVSIEQIDVDRREALDMTAAIFEAGIEIGVLVRRSTGCG